MRLVSIMEMAGLLDCLDELIKNAKKRMYQAQKFKDRSQN